MYTSRSKKEPLLVFELLKSVAVELSLLQFSFAVKVKKTGEIIWDDFKIAVNSFTCYFKIVSPTLQYIYEQVSHIRGPQTNFIVSPRKIAKKRVAEWPRKLAISDYRCQPHVHSMFTRHKRNNIMDGVRHSKAPPLQVLGAHLLWGYCLFRCTPIGRGEKTSLQYGDVWDQVRKVRQAKE